MPEFSSDREKEIIVAMALAMETADGYDRSCTWDGYIAAARRQYRAHEEMLAAVEKQVTAEIADALMGE